MTFLIPNNLLIDQIINHDVPNIKGYKKEKLIYILHLINDIRSCKSNSDEADAYTPLSSAQLKKNIGNNYVDFLNYLVLKDVIETNNQYYEGNCIGYRFTERYRTPVRPYQIKCPKFKKKIYNDQKPHKALIRKYGFTVKNFKKLKINEKAALQFLEDELRFKQESPDYKQKSVNKHSKKYRGLSIETKYTISKQSNNLVKKDPVKQYNRAVGCVEKLKQQVFNIKVDTTGNRLHHILTSMNKNLRNFVYVDEGSLVSIDIKNSQPYHSLIFFDERFYNPYKKTVCPDTRKQYKRLIEEDSINSISRYFVSSSLHDFKYSSSVYIGNQEYYNKAYNYSVTGSYDIEYSFGDNGATLLSLCSPNDIQYSSTTQSGTELQSKTKIVNTGYVDLVKNGLLYEFMLQEIEARFDVKFKNRNEVKETMFLVLYSNNRFLGQEEAKYKKVFKELFQREYELFSVIKKKKHRDLAVILQQLESHFILDIILRRIALERPDVIVYTIHDSIVTTSNNVDYVAEIMREELEKGIGYPPTLNYEKAWCIANAKHSNGTLFVLNSDPC